MIDLRKYGDQHILKSLKEINENTWLIGNLILQRFPDSSAKHATWKDEDGSSFILSVAPKPLPTASTDISSPHIRLIHEAGDASAVWSVGNNAICKARFTMVGITSESTTLRYVQEQKPSFLTPEIFYHGYDSDRNFLFLRKVPGKTLFEIWPGLNDHARQLYVNEIVRIIREMEKWKGHIGGVDGQGIVENWICVARFNNDFSPKNLQANCEEMGMDCSDCVFDHNDLAPTNILVEGGPEVVRVGVVDFELAGFFPKSWIRTKFKVSWAFDLDEKTNSDPKLFRTMMEKTLQTYGYDDLSGIWRKRLDQANQS